MAANNFDLKGTVLNSYTGDDSEVVIPAGVTEIGFCAFSDNTALESIVIPDTVTRIRRYAFRNCTNLRNIVIPESVAECGSSAFKNCPLLQDENGLVIIRDIVFDYFGNAEGLTVPDGVSVISGHAFENCQSLVNVILPDTVTSIEEGAFCFCSNMASIRIPASVKEIGFCAFSCCEKLEQIGSPTGVQSIQGSGGFSDCEKLADEDGFIIVNNFLVKYIGKASEVTVLPSIETICVNAFASCKTISCITIPENVKKIEHSAFCRCRSLKTIRMNGPIQVEEDSLFSECSLDVNTFRETDIIWFYMNISKGKAVTECEQRIASDFDANIRKMLILLDGKAKSNKNLRLAKLIVKYKDKISDSTRKLIQEYFDRNDAKQAVSLLVKNNIIKGNDITEAKKLAKEMKEKAAREAEIAEDAEKLKNHERPDEKEVEDYVSKLLGKEPLRYDVYNSVKNTVYYRNSHIPVQDRVLKIILTIYANEFERVARKEYGSFNTHDELYDGCPITISKECDYIYSYIDPVSFDALLLQLVNSKDYRKYVLSFGRFATERTVKDVISHVKMRKKGTAREKYWANNVEQALIINDTAAAMYYYDSIKKLDAYAAKRKMTAQELRDTLMIPDYGFDHNGIKKYQLGSLDLNVSVRPDLTLAVYDCNAGKELRSFPSKAKNADAEELNDLKEDFKKLGKEVKKYGKEKLRNIKQLHISGDFINKDTWIKAYAEQPVIRNLSECIVWSDGKSYFIPTRSGIQDVSGNTYNPADKIKVANVLDMEPAEIAEWQNYIIDHNIRQPFEQMWEPAFDLNKYHDASEFAGLTISSSERNAMKKELKEKGIEVYSDDIASEYDYQARKYVFNDYNTMHFGIYADADYTINDDKSITFDNIRLKKGRNRNAANTILFSLHKILMEQIVSSDSDDKLSREELSLFTLAQILSFIAIAEENHSVRCKAILLDYKNENYPDYNVLDDLLLEL